MAGQQKQYQTNYGKQCQAYCVQPAVMTQPTGTATGLVTWMPAKAPIMGCPPGMEYLTQLDQLLVKQETQMLRVLTGWECKKKFRVLNNQGQQVYYALEESGFCQRMCCRTQRGFVYHITDNTQREIFRVRRDFKYCSGMFCCPCDGCRYHGIVEDRFGTVLGHVSNSTCSCSPRFTIFDADMSMVAEIMGVGEMVTCRGDVDFPIIDVKNGTEIGKIGKQWPGLLKTIFTDSENFRVSFPIDMDVKKKALMFGAMFIIDIMLYTAEC